MSVRMSRNAGAQLREEDPGPGSLGSNPHPSTYLMCDPERVTQASCALVSPLSNVDKNGFYLWG